MWYATWMRTTLDLDEDVLLVAKQLARQRAQTAGKVISDLVRKALEPGKPPRVRHGVALFVPKAGAPKPGLALVNRIRDGSA